MLEMRIGGLVRSVTPYRLGIDCTFRARFSTGTPNGTFLQISDEIQEALHSKKPVVALETTIYTHGTRFNS